MRTLTPLEARVLGVLVEKQATVPDTYPLTLNSLVAGCNQKTARDPVINASESDILAAIDGLKSQSLVFESSGGRVARYEHNAARGIGVPGAAAALLAVLMLRGPQTVAELRANAERLHRFADISSVEGFLTELAERYPPRAVLLPRAPGARESRWAHLLCGEVVPATLAPRETGGSDDDAISVGELVALKTEIRRQGDEITALRALVLRMAGELGMAVEDAAAAPSSAPEA
ncbi:YceH family protein [Aquabacterium sp. OR-4]|uniref:YceH family protein n=1 Tax=Aquabacterium sp. OR-4 TaxID=2978127 RepID=UPI0021B2398B|nr:YceH family protein [Aquabacterium sp. OR-4]MDT7835691.1 YceH family protein [Aquabacterium sp. OR-4]